MKKYLTLLAAASLFAACEQRVESPAAVPADHTESHETTIVNPPADTPEAVTTETETTTTEMPAIPAATPEAAMETTTEETTTTTETPMAE